jgi:protein-S-isoprenylcysteine O-methyltransferase Ste14
MTILVVSMLWLGSEIALARMKHSQSTDTQSDKSSLRILWSAIIVSVTAGVVLSAQHVGSFSDHGKIVWATGLVLIILGLVIRWAAILTLRHQFTVDVAITKDHRIIREGLYKVIRHPAYLGSLLSFLGLGLTFRNYLGLIVLIVPIGAAFLFRIRVEEQMLVGAFGDEYVSYSTSTKRLIPGIF